MKLIVQNHLTYVKSKTPNEEKWLIKLLSFPDGKTGFVKQGGHLKRVKPKMIRMYKIMTGSFPTGYLNYVVQEAQKINMTCSVEYDLHQVHQPDMSADLGWLRDYQVEAVNRVTEKKRGILWHPTGCLTGDTVVTINRGGCARQYKLKTIVDRMKGRKTKGRNGKVSSWDLSIPTYTQTLIDGVVRKNQIIKCWENGIQEVFEVTDSEGYTIRATKSHKFMTSDKGTFTELKDLLVGDTILRASLPKSSKKALKKRSYYVQVGGMQNHPYVSVVYTNRNERICIVPKHRLVAEASLNGIGLYELVGRLHLGEVDGLSFIDPNIYAVHHKDGNHKNNKLENLEVMTHEEHNRHHSKELASHKHLLGGFYETKIKSITAVGSDETYDLTVLGPHHNYVANGFLVSNSGKTDTAIGLTRRLPVKWMFFVNQKDLMHQAADRYEKRTGIRAGLLGDGIVRSPEGNLTVATFQTLAAKKDHPKIIKILEQVEGVIVDEAHTLPADSFFETIMKTKNAYYRVGMSGTPLARGDKRSVMTVGALGPVIHRIKPETLIERGLLSRPTVRMVRCYQESQKPTWQGVNTELICNSVKRNNIVADIVSKKSDYPCLVFVDKVKHGKELLKRIQKKGVNAEFVWGDKNTPQRQAAIERLVRTDTDVLICSTIFQTGVDIPEVKEIVVACGGKSAIATIQRVGRAMRISEGKRSCVVWDFADTGNKWLEKHAKLRQKAYTDEGYETIVDKEMSE